MIILGICSHYHIDMHSIHIYIDLKILVGYELKTSQSRIRYFTMLLQEELGLDFMVN